VKPVQRVPWARLGRKALRATLARKVHKAQRERRVPLARRDRRDQINLRIRQSHAMQFTLDICVITLETSRAATVQAGYHLTTVLKSTLSKLKTANYKTK